jgi:KUP system potassium uptake protein
VDRYVAHRVDALAGFYAVTQYRGFRDDPQLRIDEIVTKISEIESRLGPDGAQQIVAQLGDLSRRPTHVYGIPHFRVAVICAEQRNAAFPIIWLRVNAWSWVESRLL